MNLYRIGYRAELKLMHLLEKSPEFHTVLRSSGSRSAFDVVAIGDTKVLLCQVKAARMPSTKAILKKLTALQVPPSAQKELWLYRRGDWTIIPVP